MRIAMSACAVALALALSTPAAFAGDGALRHVRICDASACYYAWRVVDSDGDGVSDADERVAGTDPYDARSRPSLSRLVDLLGKSMLPTFEFGLGEVVLYPEKLQETIEAANKDPLAAFPLGQRKSAASRLGISGELLSSYGIDIRQGIALQQSIDTRTGVPSRRVGGIDLSLISAGDDEPQVNDVVDFINHDDGATTYVLDNGDRIYVGVDGHGLRTDKNGKVLDDWYVNPDADTGSGKPTDEQFKAWERMRNATIRTVADRPQPTFDPDGRVKPRDLIVLIDPEYADYGGMVQDAPTIDTAQPETRPDLPNPQVPGDCGKFCGG